MQTAWKAHGDDVEAMWRRDTANALTGVQWFVDGQDVHIYERYQDSAAALAHVQRFVPSYLELVAGYARS
jgi:hypothetical protein